MENDLLLIGFELITEKDIPSYTGEEDDDLNSYENDGHYLFGYLTPDNYLIVQLDESNGDCVLRYKDGSSNFIIKCNNKLFMGSFDEGEYHISEEINKKYSKFTDESIFEDFEIDMRKMNIDFFYADNF